MSVRLHTRLVFWNLISVTLVALILARSVPQFLLATAVGGFLSLLLGSFINLRVSRPLAEVSLLVQNVAQGNLQQRWTGHGEREVAALGRSFNTMVQHLESIITRLRDGKQQAESIVSAMGEGVMVLDASGRIILTNRSLCQTIGTDRQLAGKTPLDIFRHPDLDESVRVALSGGAARVVEIVLGNNRVVEAHAAGVPNLSGMVDSAVVVFHDLTDIRRTERMRRDFVANVSHEFKTPLTAIRGYTETLLGGALDDSRTAAEFLHIVERNARHLESLVSDLLTLARLEAELPASLEAVNIKALIDEQVSSRQAAILQRSIHVINDCPPVEIQVDRIRLVTAISNLIDNAVAYNRSPGEIQISGCRENGSFILSIADTGEGIPAADLHRIFERFYRVDKARTRDSGGTGLGLAIVKHAIESQGGTITVSSKLGAGSKFSIHLPLRRVFDPASD